MGDLSVYQSVRTLVKKQLNHVIEALDVEFAIRASSPQPIDEVEASLREYLAANDLHVVHEVDVEDIHDHYNIDYPEYRILKVAGADTLRGCPMAGPALDTDPGTSVFLPPSIVLYELDGETRVSAIRPTTLLALFADDDLRETFRDLEGRLWNALEEGVPDSTMLSESPPLPPGEGETRARLKKLLYPVLKLVDAEYSIHVSTDAPRREVVESLRESLTRRGQMVLGEVAGGDILLVVNPGQAHKALAIEPDVGVFAPLSVGVYEADGRTHVRAVRPSTLLIFFTDPDLQDVLQEMEQLLWNALVEGVPDAEVHSRQPPLPPGTGQRTTAAGRPGRLGSARERRPQ